MRAQTIEMGLRYNQLRAEGKTGEEATGIINQEYGTKLSYAAIRSYGSLAKKNVQEAELSSERSEHKEHDRQGPRDKLEPILSERQEGNELEERKEDNEDILQPSSPSQAELEDRMRTIARKVFQEMIHNIPTGRNIIADAQDAPPEPETVKGEGKGRRETRDYEKVSLTVDTVLWKLFMQERDRLKVSSGRLLDIILWRHFGKPKLSFEE